MRIPVLLIAGLIALGPVAHAVEAPSPNEAPPAAMTAPPPEPSPAAQDTTGPGAITDVVEAPPPPAPAPAPPPMPAPPQEAPPPAPAAAPQVAPPPEPAVAPAMAPAPVGKPPVYLSMDFTDVDLPVLIKFMSEQTKKNFIFDERVQGKITIISPRRVTLDEAYDVFLSVLQAKGFTTVTQGNTIKIVAAREARQDTIHTGVSKDTGSSEFITRLVPLQNLESTEVVPLVAPLVSKDGMVSAFASSNTLMLIDSRANIDRIVTILAEVDGAGTPGVLRVYPLGFAVATEAAKTLTTIYLEGGPAGATPGAKGRPRAGQGRISRNVVVKIVPDTRTNSLIVYAGQEMQDDIADLLKKIDVPASAGSGKINVYYLENADAEEVSKVLASLSKERSGAPGAAPTPAPGARSRPAAGNRGGRPLRRARGRGEGHPRQGDQLPDHRRVVERLRDAGGGHQEARHPAQAGLRRGGDHGDHAQQGEGSRRGVPRRCRDRERRQEGRDHRGDQLRLRGEHKPAVRRRWPPATRSSSQDPG